MYSYTNWRGKTYQIDDKFAATFREYMVQSGCRPEDVTYVTPEYLIKNLPEIEAEERLKQLEEMWRKPAYGEAHSHQSRSDQKQV